MRQGSCRPFAALHPGQLLHPFFRCQQLCRNRRSVSFHGLVNPIVLVRKAGNLGQVGDTEDLARNRDSSFSFCPTISAVRPPMPASTSSKISVGIGSIWTSTVFNASITREISPPEAIFANGFGSDPDIGRDEELDFIHPVSPQLISLPFHFQGTLFGLDGGNK